MASQLQGALRGFTKNYIIDGWEGIDAMSYLNQVQPQVVDLLARKRQTKANLILTCIMERVDIKTGEVHSANVPCLSKTGIILDASDVKEIYKKAMDKIMESLASFQMQGSNWRFGRVIKLDINTAVYRPLRGSTYIPLPKKLANKKAIINVKNNDD